MNREKTAYILDVRVEENKVMQHFAEGGEVEVSNKNANNWGLSTDPTWAWVNYDYRIKKILPEVGKWYEIPFKDYNHYKCVAYESNYYIFFHPTVGSFVLQDNFNFMNFKQVDDHVNHS